VRAPGASTPSSDNGVRRLVAAARVGDKEPFVFSKTTLLDCRDDNLEEGEQYYVRVALSVRDAPVIRCRKTKSAARQPLLTIFESWSGL